MSKASSRIKRHLEALLPWESLPCRHELLVLALTKPMLHVSPGQELVDEETPGVLTRPAHQNHEVGVTELTQDSDLVLEPSNEGIVP